MKNLLWAVIILAVAFSLAAIINDSGASSGRPEISGTPTDFSRQGVITVNNPGQAQDVPVLVYEAPGSPALTKELIFDELSICASGNGSLPCMAMSATYGAAFGGKRVVVEGETRDGKVLVRKLSVSRDDFPAAVPAPGSVFISWADAVKAIENCMAEEIAQTHSLDVYLTLDDGRRVRAVEPAIDEVMPVAERARRECRNMVIATE